MTVEVESWALRPRADGAPGQDLRGTLVVDGGTRFEVFVPHDEVQAALRQAGAGDPAALMEWLLVDRLVNRTD